MDETLHDCHGMHHYEPSYVVIDLIGTKQLMWVCEHCPVTAGGILTIGPEGFDA